MSSDKKLKPLDLTEDKDRYQAVEEIKHINFDKCTHPAKGLTIKDGQVTCKCGVGWQGHSLDKLVKLLKKQ